MAALASKHVQPELPLAHSKVSVAATAGLNVHLYQSCIEFESRMLKITKSLACAWYFGEIVLIGKWCEGLSPIEHLDESRRIQRIRTFVPSRVTSTICRILQTLEWMLLYSLKSTTQTRVRELPQPGCPAIGCRDQMDHGLPVSLRHP